MRRRSGGTYFLPGAHSVICDRTGMKLKSTQVQREWTGSIVRKQSWESRHPQDLIRGKTDRQAVADPRTEQPDRFLEAGDVSAEDL